MEHTIVLLGRTSNKKQVDILLTNIMHNSTMHITKLEYSKEFKNYLIWGIYYT